MRSIKISFVPACLLISALAVGCNRDVDTPATTVDQPVVKEGETPMGQTPEAAGQLSEEGREFVMTAAKHGLFEVEAGRMAQTKAQIEGTKQLANKMVDEYAKHNDELQKMIQDKAVSFPTELTDDAKDATEDLAEKEGEGFDKDYVEAVIDHHQKVIDEFEEQAKLDRDPQLQQYATRMLPVMRSYLEEAKRVQEQKVEPKTGLFD